MSIRESFVERFGEDQAKAIESAAEEHKNGVHDNPGSDYFRWAIVICIGHECFLKDSYREGHGITAPAAEIEEWIREKANIADHDGDCDYIAMMCGVYNKYVVQPEQPTEAA